MYPTDPTTIGQLRAAQLIEAEQTRTHRTPIPARPRGSRRTLAEWMASVRAPAPRATVASFGSHDLFVGLDRRTLRKVERLFFVVDVDAGDSLGRQGDVVPEFVVVLDGRVGVSVDGGPLAVLDAGSHFGALPLLDDGPMPYRRASFNVLGPGTVAVANRSQFHELMTSFPLVADRVRAISDVRRAYLAGRADSGIEERVRKEFPLHLADVR